MNGLDRQSTFKAITVCGGLVRFGSLLRWKLQKHRQWIGISLNSGMTETKFARHLPWATLLLLGALWLVVINQLRIEWTINPQYNFGWSVPVLCLYLLWERWKRRPEIVAPCRTNWPKWFIGCLVFGFLFIRL